jgi:hypothetical protein
MHDGFFAYVLPLLLSPSSSVSLHVFFLPLGLLTAFTFFFLLHMCSDQLDM